MKLGTIKGYSGWIIVTVLSLSPLLIWGSIKPLDLRFATPSATATSIGQMLGLIGMAMFALTLVLSTRHPILERFFNGMNQVYIAHHRFGAIAFSLLLFHPIVLALKYVMIASTRDAALFLLSTDLDIVLGTGALLSMMLFLILTFFVSFAYDKWKITHKFLAVSFILASVHTLIIYSDTQTAPLLYWYMAAFAALGMIPIVYRTMAPQLFVSYTEYIVDEVRKLDERTTELFMRPAFKPIGHKAGQFIFVSIKDESIGKESHPFSITSAPHDPRLSIAVKALGDYTGKLQVVKKDTIVKIEGPFGAFSYKQGKHKEQVWIAGGIGITPFISMARSIVDPDYRITIYYCVNDRSEAVFMEELTALAEKNPNIRPVAFCSNDRGRISADTLESLEGDIFSKDFFICGPPAMMQGLRQQLIKKGVNASHIHTEEFSFR